MVRFVVYPICGDYEAFPPFKALDRLGEQLFKPSCDGSISVRPDNGGCLCDRRGVSASEKLRKRRSSADEFGVSAGSGSQLALSCDVRGYTPEEITVKTVGNDVVVSGQHEEQGDDGSYLKMEFTRRFALPEGVDSESVTCRLSASGVLAIEAPRAAPPCKKLRVIPVSVESAPSSQVSGPKTSEKPDSESSNAAAPAS